MNCGALSVLVQMGLMCFNLKNLELKTEIDQNIDDIVERKVFLHFRNTSPWLAEQKVFLRRSKVDRDLQGDGIIQFPSPFSHKRILNNPKHCRGRLAKVKNVRFIIFSSLQTVVYTHLTPGFFQAEIYFP